MPKLSVAEFVVGLALFVALPAHAATKPMCFDAARVEAAAHSLGMQTEHTVSEGIAILAVQTRGGAVFGISEVASKENGCMGMLFAIPFGADDGTNDKFYTKFNSSPENGFAGIAGSLAGQVSLVRFSISKFGFADGNLGLEISAFARAVDKFKSSWVGVTAFAPLPVRPNALAPNPLQDAPDVERVYKAIAKATGHTRLRAK